MSGWWSRIMRSVVQSGIRRAELWLTKSRSKGSRVQSSRSADRTRLASMISSMMNRLSFMTLSVNSGLRTESRPISARNWISRNETGEMPQGRYRSNHGNLASRFEPRTSQTKKWVSRRMLTGFVGAVKQDRSQDATPTTTDPPHRRGALSRVSYNLDWLSHFSKHWSLPAAAQSVVPSARLRSLRHEALRREDGTSVFWLRTPLRSSCVQCTIMAHDEQWVSLTKSHTTNYGE